jgi:ligand-binding sensor domain-containing protein/two-component sensor histidine kinase
MWAVGGNSVFYLEDTTGRFRSADNTLSMNDQTLTIIRIADGHDGSLWLGTVSGIFRRMSDGRLINYDFGIPWDRYLIVSLLVDRQGRLWIAPRGGLGLVRVENPDEADVAGNQKKVALTFELFTTKDGLPSNDITYLFESTDGRFWIGTARGLIEFRDGRFEDYMTKASFASRHITALAEDRDGNLWVGTMAGLMRLSLQGLITYDESDGLGDNRIHSVYEDAGSNLMTVSGVWSLNRFKGKRFASVRPHMPRDSRFSWGCQVGFLDRSGRWWLLTSDGLRRFEQPWKFEELNGRRPERVFTIGEGLVDDDVHCLFEDSRGNIWVSCRGSVSGLARWDHATGKFLAFSEADGLTPSFAPSAFCEDSAKTVWIGSYGGELAVYRNGRFKSFDEEDGVPTGMVTSLHCDRSGRVWMSSNKAGLTRISDPSADQPTFVSITTQDGLASNNVRCITEDRYGYIYAGSVRGVDRLDPVTGRIRHFSTRDGMASDFVTAAYRDSRGELWFGTVDGISRLVPQPDREMAPSSIRISSLRVDGVEYPLPELGTTAVLLPEMHPDQNHVEIKFVSIGFGVGEVLRYQYKLEGVDDDWGIISRQRTVTYASLSPGSYHFAVRAINADGMTSPIPATVEFVILPPVWQRWWFVTIAIVLIVVIAYALYKYRVNRLLEIERVRVQISYDLHDEIASNLSSIAMFGTIIKGKISLGEEVDGLVSALLDRVTTLAQESVGSIRDIIWAISPKPESLDSLLTRLQDTVVPACRARGIQVTFKWPSVELPSTNLDPQTRQNLWLLLKEAISNAVKHSECTEIAIRTEVAANRLAVTITDNGKGFDVAEAAHKGKGLGTMNTRAERLKGDMEVKSSTGNGTTIVINVRLRNEALVRS